MAVKYNLYLYVNGTCLVFQSKNVKDVEKQLNEDFANTCDKFVDNKLHSHLGEDNTKSILFVSKRQIRKAPNFDIIYNNVRIKQHCRVTYLRCIFEETMSGEFMAHKLSRDVFPAAKIRKEGSPKVLNNYQISFQ